MGLRRASTGVDAVLCPLHSGGGAPDVRCSFNRWFPTGKYNL
jgi:hypothetical protein